MRRRIWLGLVAGLSTACAAPKAAEPARVPVDVTPVVAAAPVDPAPTVAASTEIAARSKVMIEADDGHPLALWSRRPAASKGAIVLLHGRTWSGVPDFDLDLEVDGKTRSLMRSLAEAGWAAYALDLRGYGATGRDASGWNTPDRAAKDLGVAIAYVRAQHPELGAPAVLGWSLGSLVAQLAAQRDAASMSALVLYGYPRDPDRAGKGGGAVGAKPARAPNTVAAAASDFITPGSIDRASVDAFVTAALAADPVRADWRKMDEFAALDPSKVQVPTLVIHGAGDPFAPIASQAKLFSRLGDPDRAWVIVEGGDHAAHLEDCGGRFVHAVVGFLERDS